MNLENLSIGQLLAQQDPREQAKVINRYAEELKKYCSGDNSVHLFGLTCASILAGLNQPAVELIKELHAFIELRNE